MGATGIGELGGSARVSLLGVCSSRRAAMTNDAATLVAVIGAHSFNLLDHGTVSEALDPLMAGKASFLSCCVGIDRGHLRKAIARSSKEDHTESDNE